MPGYTQQHIALAANLQQIESDRQRAGWRSASSLHLVTHDGARLRYQMVGKAGHTHVLGEPREEAEFISGTILTAASVTGRPVAIALCCELCHGCGRPEPAIHAGHEAHARIVAAVGLDRTHYLVMRRRSDHHIITARAPHAGHIKGIHLQQPFQALTGLLQRFERDPADTSDALDESV